jgi:hypothetical protein
MSPTDGKTTTNQPTHNADGFVCPHCQAWTHQRWWDIGAWRASPALANTGSGARVVRGEIDGLTVSFCERCDGYCLWVKAEMVYPCTSTAPLPSDDMPQEVKEDYLEARTVFDRSPRSAAALLRLGLQKLMPHVGEKGKDINTDIKNLVTKGLPAQVQQALDAVRVIGNNAVHPGQLDLNDEKETAASLFGLVNFIVDRVITHPKELQKLYNSLPQSSRDAIDRRDGRK